MEKKRQDLAYLYFVKIWVESPILYCIKNKELQLNSFCIIHTFWQVFQVLVAFCSNKENSWNFMIC